MYQPEKALLLVEDQQQGSSACPLRNFEEFYRENHEEIQKAVRTYLLRRGINTNGISDADDLIQDMWLIALRNWERIGRMANPQGYLVTVGQSLLYKAMSRFSREALIADTAFFDRPDGDQPYQKVAAVDQLIRLLVSLPKRQAEILVMSAYGLTDTEIGSMLSLQPATVRSHRRHAHQHLATARTDANEINA